MPINVTCPSCLKRFTVSDKFAGKSGPCPSCEKTIKIPEKSEEVVIHAPASSGPTDASGRAILKPIRRKDIKISTPVLVGAGLATLAVFAIAFGLGLSGEQPHWALLAIGALVLSFPIAFVGYWFLQDEDLEAYNGQQLLVRCGICGVAFASIWAIYGFVPKYVAGMTSMAEYSALVMLIFLAVMIVIGTIASVLTLELEVLQGGLHYVFYLTLTFVLAWLSGTHLSEPLSGSASDDPPGVVSPTQDESGGEQNAKPDIPDMLQ